ncbi:MAG: ribosome maturation factor RimM [Hyphomicrobiales bacterium]|nr:ribosome maturation factor RimM [Hyphomicrobiales bacterium]
MAGPATERVVIARIGAAHGVRGEVRVKAFTAVPGDFTAYGPLEAPDGRIFAVEASRPAGGSSPDMLVVRFAGIADRNQAETLNGIELGVPRERLPQPEAEEFYHRDLIGLVASTAGGEPLGKVVAVSNFGAGDLLEIAPSHGETLLIPFTRQTVPAVDLASGRIVVALPEEIVAQPDETAE